MSVDEHSEAEPEAPEATSPVVPEEDGEARMTFTGRILSAVAALGLLAVGVLFAIAMVSTRPQAERTAREVQGMPVVVTELQPSTEPITVSAQGTVVPARQVALSPELQARVTWVSPALVPGGRVSEGDTLLRMDGRDFRAAVEQQQAQIASSEVSLQQEESRRVVAQREWTLLQERLGSSPEGRELALREPQVRSAEAGVRAAQSALRQARTQLSRTTLRAPFNAVVTEETAELGMLARPGNPLATLVGTDHFWVRVALPVERVAWLRFPSGEGGGASEGSRVIIRQVLGERGAIERPGRVLRLQGDLDPVGRMARVLVEVDFPMARDPDAPPGDPRSLPLFLNALAEVEIEAGQLEDVYAIPRTALHENDTVYLYGDDDRLVVEEVDILWRRRDDVLARGLAPGARLITSRVPTPIPGTLLQLAEASAGEASAEEAPDDEALGDEASP
jgi:RND family efflux transporter MFP subunit